MMNNSKIGLALVGGYLLGRTRKAKMAIGLGMFLAGKKLDINPQQLVKMVANSPVVGRLSDQVRKDLVDNTKSALTSAVTQRAGSIADTLHERTLDINDPSRSAKRSEDAESAEDGEERAEDSRDEREERDERPRARKAAAASGRTAKTARTARTAKSAGSSASANGKAASARRSAGSGGGARNTASSGTRKATGGARKTAAKTASGGARKVTNRGGGNG